MPFIKHEEFLKSISCRSKKHNPPTMIVLEDGVHTWACPDCGVQQEIVINRPTN